MADIQRQLQQALRKHALPARTPRGHAPQDPIHPREQRQRNAVLQRNAILQRIEGEAPDLHLRESSDDTKRSLVRVEEAAKKHRDDPSYDFAMLETAFEGIKTSIESREQLQQLQFLLSLGDWCGEMHKILRHYDSTDTAVLIACKKMHEAEGLSDDEVTNLRAKMWKITKGRVDDLLALVAGEREAVRLWNRSGTHVPGTPLLGRLQAVCGETPISLTEYFTCAEVYQKRNVHAHHPPPELEEYLDFNTGLVDWVALKAECERRQKALDQALDSPKHRELGKAIIQKWFDYQVVLNGGDSSDPTPTSFAQARIEAAMNKKTQPHNPYHGLNAKDYEFKESDDLCGPPPPAKGGCTAGPEEATDNKSVSVGSGSPDPDGSDNVLKGVGR